MKSLFFCIGLFLLQSSLFSQSKDVSYGKFKYFTIQNSNETIVFPGEITHIESEGITPFCFYKTQGEYEIQFTEDYCNYIKNGKILNKKRYLRTYPFKEGLARVLDTNLRYGYINKNGEDAIPPIYTKAEDFSESLALVQQEDKIYYIDAKGKQIISLPYGRAFSFSEGLALYGTRGKYGYLDKKGKFVIPQKFISKLDEPGPVSENYIEPPSPKANFKNGIAIVQDGQLNFLAIDQKGKIIYKSKSNNLYRNEEDPTIIFEHLEDGTQYYIYENLKFQKLKNYSPNESIEDADELKKWNKETEFQLSSNGKVEFENNLDNKLFNKKSKDFLFPLKISKLETNTIQSNFGYINSEGNPIFTTDYDFLGNTMDGLVIFGKGNEFGYLSIDGNLAFKRKFEFATNFSNGLASVKFEGKWGVINIKGEYLVKPTYDDMKEFNDGLAGVLVGDKWGFIDKTGKMVIKPQYSNVGTPRDGMIPVSNGSNFGFINYSNKLILPFKFLEPIPFRGGILENSPEEDGSYCTYTTKGKILNGCFFTQG
jgi:hypothetical protein